MEKNLLHMIELVNACFGNQEDPEQLAVDEEVKARLGRIHPRCMGEERREEGPIAWTLVIPSTQALMESFLAGEISERAFYEATPEQGPYGAIYLCSALVHTEFRHQGIARRLLEDSLRAILAQHPVQTLFFWTFSEAGQALAQTLATAFALPLRCRPR